jgi:hypothetical protein
MILKSTMTSGKVTPNVKRTPKPGELRTPTREQLKSATRRNKPNPALQTQVRDEAPAESKPFKERIKAWKLIGIIILVGVAGLAYVNHVFKTQEILTEVNQLEQEFEKVRRIHADRKFQFERMTGPSDVYLRATQQGFVHGGAAEGVVVVKP